MLAHLKGVVDDLLSFCQIKTGTSSLFLQLYFKNSFIYIAQKSQPHCLSTYNLYSERHQTLSAASCSELWSGFDYFLSISYSPEVDVALVLLAVMSIKPVHNWNHQKNHCKRHFAGTDTSTHRPHLASFINFSNSSEVVRHNSCFLKFIGRQSRLMWPRTAKNINAY